MCKLHSFIILFLPLGANIAPLHRRLRQEKGSVSLLIVLLCITSWFMETKIGETKYQELVQWQHPRDQNITWSYVKHQGPHKNLQRDDCIVVSPVLNDGKEPELVFETHIRPPRMQRANSGLTIELVGALATDDASKGEGLEANAKRELYEEMGLKVTKMHKAIDNIPGDVGSMDGSCSMFVAECEQDGKIGPRDDIDVGELALFSIPLKDSIRYLMDATKRGVDVTTVAIIGALNALKQFNIQPVFEGEIPKPKLLWTIANGNPNELQKDGLAALKANQAFLPEAAVVAQAEGGLLSKTWNWFKGLFAK